MNTIHTTFSTKKSNLLSVVAFLLAFAAQAGNPPALLPIQLSFSFNQPSCNGYTNGDATVTPSGGTAPYTYLWNNGQQGQTNFGLAAGSYSVTVTDASGETASGSVTVTQPGPVVAAITASGVDCDGPPVTLTAFGSGGTGPYAFSWNTGANTALITAGTPGAYFVTATDAHGCIDNETALVEAASEFAVSYQFTPPNCAGNTNGSITATAFGTYPPFSYVWNTGVSGQTLNNVPAGNYTLTVSDAHNCTFTETVTLQGYSPLQVDVVANDIPCSIYPNGGVAIANATGGVGPYNYAWSNGGNTPIQQNLPPGYYSATVTDQNGCTAVDGDTISIPLPLDGTVVSISPACGDSTGCITVQGIGGTPPYMYMWPELGLSGPTVCGLPPGLYYVCVFDANHCQHDLNVTMDSISNLNVTLITTKADCQGIDNGTATAIVSPPGGAYQYHWNIQNSPPVAQLNGIPAGTTVCVTVTDVNSGCSGTACAVIGTHTIVHLQVTDTDVTCAGDATGSATAIASSGTLPYTYIWTYPDSTQVNGSTITNLGAGAYSVWVTDDHGCTAVGVADVGVLSDLNAAFQTATLDCLGGLVTVQFTDVSSETTSQIVSWNWTIVSGNGTFQFNGQNPPNQQFTQNETGIATLVVTSAAGCTDTVSAPFTVSGIPNLSVNVPNPAVDCQNDPIPITVTGGGPGLHYQWSPTTGLTFVGGDSTNVLADPAVTTTYTLTVSSGDCAGQYEVTVIRVVPIDVSLADDTVETCNNTATLDVSLNTPANVTWYDLAGNPLGTGLSITVPAGATALYTAVGVGPYGCADTASASVTGVGVNVAVSAPPPGAVCENAPFQLYANNLNPGDNLSYQWAAIPATGVTFSPNANVANPVVTAPAGSFVFTLTVENQHDCTKEISVPLTVQPGASLAGQIEKDVCNGLEVAFVNNSNIPGIWYFGNGDSSLVNDPIYTYPQAGNYTVQFIPGQICVLPYVENITVTTEVMTAAFTASQTTCVGEAVLQFADQTGGAPTGWQWIFPGGTPATSNQQNPTVTFVGDGPVTAVLIVNNAANCPDTASLPVSFNVIDNDIVNPGSFCAGEPVALNPDFNPDYTYLWASDPVDSTLVNDPNPVVSPTVTTTYFVTITNGACVVEDQAVVTVSGALTAAFTASQTSCVGEATLQFTDQTGGAPTDWHWTFPGGTPGTSTDQNPVVTYDQDGTITATLVVNNNVSNCPDTISLPVSFSVVDDDVASPGSFCAGESVALNPDFNANYIYHWTSEPVDSNLVDDPNPVVSPDVTTTYFVTITNGACVVEDQAVVTVAPALTAAFTASQTNCVGEATLQFTDQTGGAPTDWHWTFPGGTPGTSTDQNPVVTYGQDGTITATLVVNNNVSNCPDTISLPVSFSVVDDDVASPGSFCAGESVALNPDFNANYIYHWSSEPVDSNLVDDPNPVVSPDVTTTYFVTITNGACVVEDQAVVTVAPALTAAFGVNQVNCLGQAELNFTDQTAGEPDSWQWIFPGGTPPTSGQQHPTVTFSEDGTVTVTLIVNNSLHNCPDTVSLPVSFNLVDNDIVSPGNLCPGETVGLNPDFNPNYTYQWSSNPLDTNLVNEPNPVVSPDTTTMYFVTITNGTCSVNDTSTVALSPAATLELSADTTVCNNDPLTLQVVSSNGIQFEWSESPSFDPIFAVGPSVSVTPVPNGIYYARTLNAFNCPAVDSVLANNATVAIEAEPAQRNICLGTSAELTITNLHPGDTLSYVWSPDLPNIANPTVTPSDDMTFTVTVTNQFGCQETASFQVDVITLAIAAEIDGKTTICPGDSTTLVVTPNGGSNYLYEWSPAESLSAPFDSLTLAFPGETTTYTVTVTEAGTTCTATAQLTVTFMFNECVEPYIFVPKAFTPNNDGNNDLFRVRGLNIKEIYFVVYDRWGEKVYETNDPAHTGWDGIYNGHELTPDAYGWYLRATCGNGAVYENQGNVTLLK